MINIPTKVGNQNTATTHFEKLSLKELSSKNIPIAELTHF